MTRKSAVTAIHFKLMEKLSQISFSGSGWNSCHIQPSARMLINEVYAREATVRDTSCLTSRRYSGQYFSFVTCTDCDAVISANSQLYFFLLRTKCSWKFLNPSMDNNRRVHRLGQESADFSFITLCRVQCWTKYRFRGRAFQTSRKCFLCQQLPKPFFEWRKGTDCCAELNIPSWCF